MGYAIGITYSSAIIRHLLMHLPKAKQKATIDDPPEALKLTDKAPRQ
jgi:hypothetical protein